MEQIIEVQVRSVYGQERIYPINDKAKLLAKLLNRKTFTSADISIVRELGFTVKWVPVTL